MRVALHHRSGRIIPAPAGNTPGRSCAAGATPDHPRACGEHEFRDVSSRPSDGSSPRLRGTQHAPLRKDLRWRIIPAPAGNTCVEPPHALILSDHPRACGEHHIEHIRAHSGHGSSPRLRGTLWRIDRDMRRCRIIPAPAGNTSLPTSMFIWSTDHPRACGEHWLAGEEEVLQAGSSPRLRGTRHLAQPIHAVGRIIPAPAGNTRGNPWASSPRTDHPRACGEHVKRMHTFVLLLGSSPRLRGTPGTVGQDGGRRRIIPAPAGNTEIKSVIGIYDSDHPRACGEHLTNCRRRCYVAGSSPRLRGTLLCNIQ